MAAERKALARRRSKMPKASMYTLSRRRVACLSVTFAISALLGLASSSFAQQEPEPFGAKDMETISKTYLYNRIRFDRYFKGRAFQAILPIHRIQADSDDRIVVELGPDTKANVNCVVTDPPTIKTVTEWDTGQMVKVSGKIRSVFFDRIRLDNCQYVPQPK